MATKQRGKRTASGQSSADPVRTRERRDAPSLEVAKRLVGTKAAAGLEGVSEQTLYKRLQRNQSLVQPYRIRVGQRWRLRWDPIEICEAMGGGE